MQTLWNVKQAVRLAAEINGEWTRLSLGEMLKQTRKFRAMDQNELARLSGFSQSTISDLETGRTDPPWGTVRQVLAALDCAPLILLRALNEWPKRPSQWRAEKPPIP